MSFAERALLHKNKLEDFKVYLALHGVAYRAGKGDYELMQIQLGTQWHKIYKRDKMPEHVTVQGALVGVVKAFVAGRDPHVPAPPPVERRKEADGAETFITRGAHAPRVFPDSTTPPWE